MTISKVLTGAYANMWQTMPVTSRRWNCSPLKNFFTTAEALDAGRQLKVTERTVMNYLKELAKNRLIHKVRQGVYEKVSFTAENRNCNV